MRLYPNLVIYSGKKLANQCIFNVVLAITGKSLTETVALKTDKAAKKDR